MLDALLGVWLLLRMSGAVGVMNVAAPQQYLFHPCGFRLFQQRAAPLLGEDACLGCQAVEQALQLG